MIRIAKHAQLLAFSTVLCLLTSLQSFAHPMGNFSISHYSGIRVERKFVEVRYLIDMAEIPSFQEIQQNDLAAQSDDRRTRAYMAKLGEMLKSRLTLSLDGRDLILQTRSSEVIFSPGAGGLPTMKMAFLYRAAIETDQKRSYTVGLERSNAAVDESALYYRDENYPNRVGWKEIVATEGPGATFTSSSVAKNDRSSQLSIYSTDLLNSPPTDLQATIHVRWDKGPASNRLSASVLAGSRSAAGKSANTRNSRGDQSTEKELASVSEASEANSSAAQLLPHLLPPNKQATPQNRFTQLMTTKEFGVWFLIGAAAIAAGLGALHALEPGHGKTVVAAYLVGSKGTAYHAFLLGLIVTASHTAGVYLLGAVTLYASRYIVPEQLYPWLGAISGLLIAALGSYLFSQRFAGPEPGHTHGPFGHHHANSATDHSHLHEHDGSLHSHVNDHYGHHHHEIQGDVSYRQLLALGITGGIVPCPAALVVLLSAVALNRVGFGLFLIVAFSFGLAAVLIAVGMLMVYARKFMSRFRGEGPVITRWLPLASAGAITCLGIGIAIRSLITGGILPIAV